jgi:carbamoyl-phosphate synthase/aspartate carbamoyltransferase/dihydroorotase
MLELPGLIDPHVHLREPGGIHKEDFQSGTAAALAGGFTAVLAMPNTQPPLTDEMTLEQAKAAAREKAICDYGIFLGAGAENALTAARIATRVCGLKMYMDQTFGPLRLGELKSFQEHLHHWPASRPIAVHAEGISMAAILLLARLQDRSVHICHVSRREEILLIRAAKEKGFAVTCEVTPHHLFLTEDDIPQLGPGRSNVRPRLATKADQAALWENLAVIDCFASDHAPHTPEEKDSENPPPGFPGLETSLGLFLTAVSERRLTLDDCLNKMVVRPRQIYRLPEQAETRIKVDEDATWEVRGADLRSRCGWSPFEGYKLKGRVTQVELRGRIVYQRGEITVPAGYGRDLALLIT